MMSFAAIRFIVGFGGDAALGIPSQPVQFLGNGFGTTAVHGYCQEGGATPDTPVFPAGVIGMVLFCGVCVGFHGRRMKIPRQQCGCRGVDYVGCYWIYACFL